MAAFLSRVLDDADFAQRKLSLVPAVLRADAEREYQRRYAENNQAGNLWLLSVADFAERHGGTDLAASDHDLRRKAAELANSPLASAGRTEAQLRRFLRRRQWRGIEKLAYKIGVVGKGRQEYASKQTISRRNAQKRGWQAFAEATMLSLGEQQISLAKIMQDSSRRRSAELYHMSKALQVVAEQDGLKWSMWTLTAPPKYHPSPSHGTSKWDDTTDPAQAHQYISTRWQRVRADLAKQGVKLSGLRVTEPHKDGCAHWHLAIFYNEEDANTIKEAFRDQWPTVAGAQETIGDPAKGCFSSYIFKYISKAVSHHGNEEISHACLAADAWRSTWGVRAFQFFGLPQLSLWRELRKQTTPPADDGHNVTALWRAARRTDGAAFIRLAGGLAASRQQYNIRQIQSTIATSQKCVFDKETGEAIPLAPRQKWAMGATAADVVTVIQSDPRGGQHPSEPVLEKEKNVHEFSDPEAWKEHCKREREAKETKASPAPAEPISIWPTRTSPTPTGNHPYTTSLAKTHPKSTLARALAAHTKKERNANRKKELEDRVAASKWHAALGH